MQGTPTDFRLYHSNALEVLAGLLAAQLRVAVVGQSLLTPDTILIPQPAMRRWLQATLAQRHGIAANLEFLTPGEFVTRALDANLGKVQDDLPANTLQWRLLAALTDAQLMARPAMAQLAGYLQGGDPLKAWSLAGELANVFEKYQAWRRDWLLRWDAGADVDDPQAMLWRTVAAARQHRARRIQDYLARFADGAALPAGLPARMFAFGTLNVSPDVLRVMATQARVGTLHFYLPTPSGRHWGDMESAGARLRVDEDPFFAAESGNPLLRDWGTAGRDFLALLGGYEVVHPSGEVAAGVDPLASDDALIAEGGLRDSLLRRMQSDLYHARALPPAQPSEGDARERLPSMRRDDPSLQFHACHTRLRELEVLRDRLRALLEPASEEGRRFDPPLQPRDIAVLAPDIDAYVPYLDAVFGGAPKDAIPYAVADASPLASEPLADVFLRLLALPVSRFGLEEILDLLSSAPLAEASQLATDDFDRLRGWLQQASARWGIDAAHRASHGAPQDDAYTWQFALDRLLLGHASGTEDDIAGVAPLSDLEGSALDALDVVLRQLRVLARHVRLLDEAAPAAQWRERLLGLLDALLPRPPSTRSGLRALERLRALIDTFAKDAAQADFDAPVPAEVVRAHFNAALNEADTRAPLLTGGVSFARMVPMRLLPFRVICLLGMNDGDFPRRDAGAGLNRLTAAIGTPERRRGDRSTREDDRQLFLQLFSAAQDVFSVSWIGRDPRDGSAREPSPLVTELLAAAATYHDDPKAAADELVVQHALQPFSPTAFGGEDARHFSYRDAWHSAAVALTSPRSVLPPWIAADTHLPGLQDQAASHSTLPLNVLHRFFAHPADAFLRHRLAMRMAERDAASEDVEPLLLPGGGLERHALDRAVFDGLLAGTPVEVLRRQLRAQGLLPSGLSGERALEAVATLLQPYLHAFNQWRGDAVVAPLTLELRIDDVTLRGQLRDVMPHGIPRLRFGKATGMSVLRNGLDALLANATGHALPLVELQEDGDGELSLRSREAWPQAKAMEAVRSLLALREEGLQRPLPFAPRSAWEFFNAVTPEKAVKAAAAKWRGSGDRTWGEGGDDAWRLALRGRDPFASESALAEFAELAYSIFGIVTEGAPRPLHAGTLQLPDIEHAEDSE